MGTYLGFALIQIKRAKDGWPEATHNLLTQLNSAGDSVSSAPADTSQRSQRRRPPWGQPRQAANHNLRELQNALTVARRIRLAAEYGEDDAVDIGMRRHSLHFFGMMRLVAILTSEFKKRF